MRPIASDLTNGTNEVTVDWMRMSPYPGSGTFDSRIFDAGVGQTADWGALNWNPATPAGTGIAISVRTGDTPTPDGTWSAPTPLANGADIPGSSRFVQYQAQLTSSDPAQTPTLSQVSIGYVLGQDTTAPTITGRTPAPNATDVPRNTNVQVQFSEPMDQSTINSSSVHLQKQGSGTDVAATVSYAGTTATLDPNADLDPSAVYTVTVDGSVKDQAGNALGAAGSWSFTTATPSFNFTDTTVSDFGAGTLDANTYISETGNGEVTLKPTEGQEFSGGPGLPAGWSSSTWESSGGGAGGTATVSGGSLHVDGAIAGTDATFGPGHSLEFVATFGATAFQHVGFGVDVNNSPNWAMFSTNNTADQLFARTNVGGTAVNTPIGSSNQYVGSPHLYRIEWDTAEIRYYVDGALVTTQAADFGTTQMRPLASDFNSGGPNLSVDWLHLSPYPASGTFESRVFDAGAGQSLNWGALTWNSATPSGTGIAISVRTGNTPIPDGTWSAFTPIATSGGDIPGNTRYLQYRAVLSTTDPNLTPSLSEVTVNGAGDISPVAVDDTATVAEDSGATTINVLANDTNTDGGPKTIDSVTQPAHGSVVITGGGTGLTYEPNANYCNDGNSTDNFTYTLNGGSTATVHLTVSCLPDAPAITATDPASPANENNPKVIGTTGGGSPTQVKIYKAAACAGSPDVTGSVTDFTGSGIAVNVADDSSTPLSAKATSPVGDSPCSNTVTYVEDSTAPDTTIDSHPSDPSNSSSASFAFSGAGAGGSFECKLDAGAFSACTSPQAYSSLAEGSHTFSVRAIDAAGNVDPTPASFTWTIDTAAPDTAIDSHPSDPSNSSSASFAFSGAGAGGSFECKLDAGAFSACTSPQAYSSLAEGSHTFSVRAIDAAGNVDPTPASFTWTIDTAAPDTAIDSHPSDPSNSSSASFAFSGAGAGGSFECKLDAGAFSACTSPQAYSSLAEGSHTFSVRAIDAAGNVDPTPASFTWTIDTAAPDTAIDSHPSDPSNSSSASFAFSGAGAGGSFECKLDAGAFSACTSPQAYSSLAEGSHTFSVRAIDAAGNVDPTPASFTWTIDTAAPDTAIDSHPSDPSNSSSASFAFSGAGAGGSFECKLDAGAFSACTSPQAYSSLAEGSHTFSVRAIDAAGNVDPTPASFTWTIDTAAPDTAIDSHPTDPSNSSSASFAFSGAGAGGSFECKLDAGAFSACTSPQAYSSLAEGSHTFSVRAIDAAGNVDPTPASFTWTIDTAAPDTAIDSHPSDPSNSSSASFAFSGAGAGGSFECKLDAGAFSACTSPQAYSSLAEGSHTFSVRAIDAAGNVDPTPASFTWTIDTAAPDTAIDSHPSDPSNSSSASFAFSGAGAGGSFECKLDAGAFSACTSPQAYSSLAEGSHTFSVRAIDAAGNVDPTPASFTWTIDTAAPDTAIDSHPSDPSNSSSASFAFSGAGAGGSFECKLDAGAFSACTSPQAYSSLAEGSHTFSVRAIDAAGNVDPTPASFTWTINTTPVDNPPVAVNDTATVAEDSGATSINVLANDTDIDGGPKTIQSVTQPAHGTVVITGGGTGLTYTPNPNYCNNGSPTDNFTYTLNGGSTATVAVDRHLRRQSAGGGQRHRNGGRGLRRHLDQRARQRHRHRRRPEDDPARSPSRPTAPW